MVASLARKNYIHRKSLLKIVVLSLLVVLCATGSFFANCQADHPTIVADANENGTPKGKLREWIQKHRDARHSQQESDSKTESLVDTSTNGKGAGVMTTDCTALNPYCPQLSVLGDAPQRSKFRGFADPSMRRDPNTGKLWLAYSWPHTLFKATTGIIMPRRLSNDPVEGYYWTLHKTGLRP